ncbi:hypothetical protein T11_6007, partial [Trichinella zimbabwensis]
LVKSALSRKNRRGVGCGKTARGVDFVERKRHGAERKPPRLFRRKPPWDEKMEVELVGRKRHLGKQIVGELLGRKRQKKRHRAEKMPPRSFSTFRKNASKVVWGKSPRTDKIQLVWILWKENGTGQKKSPQGCSAEICLVPKKWKRSWWGENGTWQENACKVVGEKSPRDGQNSGGVDFVEGKRHGAEKKPPTLFWRNPP